MISETEALEIATQYLHEEYQASGLSLAVTDRSVAFKDHDDEELAMVGLTGKFYSVTFHCDIQPSTFDPDYIILLVDAETGEPLWYPGEH